MKHLVAALSLSLCALCAIPAAAELDRPRGGGVLYGPTTITEPGYYYATGNIKGPIVIAADDVHIDLGGHSIMAAEIGLWNGNVYMEPIEAIVAESVDNVTIENGTITLAEPAIDLQNVRGFTVRGITVTAHGNVRIQGAIGTFANNTLQDTWRSHERPPDERQGTRGVLIEADFVEVRNNACPDFYDGAGFRVIGSNNSFTDNSIEFAPYCYGGCFGVYGDYNTVERNSIRHGGDSGTALSVGGDFNRVRDNVVTGGGDELGGGAFRVSGNSNVIENNRIHVSRMSYYYPFTLHGSHNFLRGNGASNDTDCFYRDCPSDPGNQVFCDYGEDTSYGEGNLLPDPR